MQESMMMEGLKKKFSLRTFAKHFLEMIVAMAIGMALLDQVAWFILSVVANIDLFASPAFFAPVMTLNMVIGMSVWMVLRRHALRSIGEMAGAMVIPLCILFCPYLAGLLSASMLPVGSMVLSLPAMILVMLYRRDMYGQGQMNYSSSHTHVHVAPR